MALLGLLFLVACQSKTREAQEEDEWIEVEEEKTVECPECDGSRYLKQTCSACGGYASTTSYTTGTTPKACSTCSGSGYIRCNKCNGHGTRTCPYCDMGTNRCLSCKGSGMLLIGNQMINCPACKGKGYQDCLLCTNGRMDCDCKDGWMICESCWGSGKRGQESFSETKTIDCTSCNGSGQTQIVCPRCEGSGEITITKKVMKRKSKLY